MSCLVLIGGEVGVARVNGSFVPLEDFPVGKLEVRSVLKSSQVQGSPLTGEDVFVRGRAVGHLSLTLGQARENRGWRRFRVKVRISYGHGLT